MLLFTSSCISYAQGGFKEKYFLQNSSSSICNNVIEAPNGNLILTGFTHDVINNCNYFTVVGTDAAGTFLWRKNYGNIKFQYLNNFLTPRGAVYKDLNAFYCAVGVRDSNNYQLGVLMKFNFNGDTLWQKEFREVYPKDVIVQGLTKSVDNGFLITGASQEPVAQTCLIIKTDINGNELWRKRIPKSVPNIHDGKSIVQDTLTQKIVIVGYQSIGSSTAWDNYSNILILDNLGNKITQKTFNNAGGGGFADVIQLKDKNFLTCGSWVTSYSGNQPYNKAILVKFDIDGNVIWSKKYDPVSFYNAIGFLYELPDGDIMMVGKADTNYQDVKPQIFRVDKDGNIKWQKHTGQFPGEIEGCYSIHPTSDKGFVLASAVPLMSSLRPYAIIKIDSTGCDTVEHWCVSVALAVNKFTELNGFNLELFPNPANDFINIKINAPEIKHFTAKFTDVTGKEVALLNLESGSNAQVNTAQYAPSLYFVTIFYEGRAVETKRLVIMR